MIIRSLLWRTVLRILLRVLVRRSQLWRRRHVPRRPLRLHGGLERRALRGCRRMHGEQRRVCSISSSQAWSAYLWLCTVHHPLQYIEKHANYLSTKLTRNFPTFSLTRWRSNAAATTRRAPTPLAARAVVDASPAGPETTATSTSTSARTPTGAAETRCATTRPAPTGAQSICLCVQYTVNKNNS